MDKHASVLFCISPLHTALSPQSIHHHLQIKMQIHLHYDDPKYLEIFEQMHLFQKSHYSFIVYGISANILRFIV
jgi:hypothetical protein